jgi:hypothetical protein
VNNCANNEYYLLKIQVFHELPTFDAKINNNNFKVLGIRREETRAGPFFQQIKSFRALIYRQFLAMVFQKPVLAAFLDPWWRWSLGFLGPDGPERIRKRNRHYGGHSEVPAGLIPLGAKGNSLFGCYSALI